MARPSLYATTRLARIIQRVKDRLKSHTHGFTAKMTTSEAPNTIIKKELSRAIDITVKPNSTIGKDPVVPRTSKIQSRPPIPLTCLLQEIDSRALVSGTSLAALASQDRLLLKHHDYHLPLVKNITQLRGFVHITVALLDGLHSMSTEHNGDDRSFASSNLRYGDFTCRKFHANMLHLILSLQQAAFNAIVRYFLDLIEDSILRWYQFWLHKKGAIDDWFAEWPNGHRPLSTTWPWNIKPALLVLWGVCWMFYDNEGIAPQNPNVPRTSEQDLWTRQASMQSQPVQQPRK
ncbi:MAG: hypothetical protein Q9217_004449 [Psora testacea]